VVKVKKLNHKGSQSTAQRNTKEKININYFFNTPGWGVKRQRVKQKEY
jgi:hypothetical protein